jgi:hypothetical protein
MLDLLRLKHGLPRGLFTDARRDGALREVLVGDLALEDPALHADDPVGRLGLGDSVVDVGTQRVKRDAPLAVPLTATHFGSTQSPGALDPNAAGPELHGRRHGLLHRPTEGDPTLELERDGLGDELRVEFGLPDLLDVDEDLLVRGELPQLCPQGLDFCAPLPDQDAGTRRVDVDDDLLPRPVDYDLGDSGVEELLLDVVPDVQILVELFAVNP